MSPHSMNRLASLLGVIIATSLSAEDARPDAPPAPARPITAPAARLAPADAVGFDGSRLGLTDCRVARQAVQGLILAICRDPEMDRGKNPGLRLIAVHHDPNGEHIRFRSPFGGGDAYTANLTVFALPRSGSQVILVDFAAEFHYGTQVFFLREHGLPRLVGNIDGMALDDDDDAAAPSRYVSVLGTSAGFQLRFSRPLIRLDRNGLPGRARPTTYHYDIGTERWTQSGN